MADSIWLEEEDSNVMPLITDMSNFSYPKEIVGKPIWEIVVKTAFYVPVIALAIVGNVLVMVVVARDKRMRTTTNYYIVNLAVADCLVTLSCTWVHLLNDLIPRWVLGAFFCKFNSFAQVLFLVASIMTLTFIACDRFFGIVFAMKAHFIERRASWTIVVLWLLSLGVASPLLVYRQRFTEVWKNYTDEWCDDNWPIVYSWDPALNITVPDQPARRGYYVFICVVLFFLPCIVMSLAYALISWTLWAAQVPGERTSKDIKDQIKLRKKIIVMLVLILAVFIICWLPQMISVLYSELRPDRSKELPAWYAHFGYFARYLAHLNSALNPLIYAGFNDNFRKVCSRDFSRMRRSTRIPEFMSRKREKIPLFHHSFQGRFLPEFHSHDKGLNRSRSAPPSSRFKTSSPLVALQLQPSPDRSLRSASSYVSDLGVTSASVTSKKTSVLQTTSFS